MDNMFGVLMAIAVIFLFFLFIREFWCWYFKSNKVIEKLAIIDLRLDTLNVQMSTQEMQLENIQRELRQLNSLREKP
jgi:TM2 domain-containing membrane protein YozV